MVHSAKAHRSNKAKRSNKARRSAKKSQKKASRGGGLESMISTALVPASLFALNHYYGNKSKKASSFKKQSLKKYTRKSF